MTTGNPPLPVPPIVKVQLVLRKLRRAQQDPMREPEFCSIIAELKQADPAAVPDHMTAKQAEKFVRRQQTRSERILTEYRISDDDVLERKIITTVSAPQSYLKFDHVKWVICVPRVMRRQVLVSAHNDLQAGHFGFRRTLERARSHFFSHRMRDYVRQFVYSCVRCHQTKQSTQPSQGERIPLSPSDPHERPFTRVGMDKFGAVRGSAAGYTCVFTAIDLLTKFAVAAAYKTATANDGAHFFLNHVCAKFGFPAELISYRGSEFAGAAFVDLLSCTPVRRIYSSPRHPQSNGQVERLNGILSQYLKVYRNADHSDWDVFVPFACHAYNSSRHETTGFSPFFLMYGYDPELSLSLRDHASADMMESFVSRQQRMEAARQVANETNQHSSGS